MKKFIIWAIVLLFVIGGGIGGCVVLVKNKKDNISAQADDTYESPSDEAKEPFVVAKDMLVLALCDNTANVCAYAHNSDNATVRYKDYDKTIIEVDTAGNVKPLNNGETTIKSYIEKDGKEYPPFVTKVVVLSLDIKAEIELVDQENNPATSPLPGDKYILNMQSNASLKYFVPTLLASDNIKVCNKKIVDDSSCCCEIYFETKAKHTLQFKFDLNADNIKHTMLTDVFVVDNSQLQNTDEPDDPGDKSDNDDPSDHGNQSDSDKPSDDPSDTDDPSDGDKPAQPDEPSDADDSSDNDDNVPNPSTPTEDPDDSDNPDDSKDPSDADDSDNKDNSDDAEDSGDTDAKEAFVFSSLEDDIVVNGSTIHISGFTPGRLISICFRAKDTNRKYLMKCEIVEGDKMDIIVETATFGFLLSKTGTWLLRLYSPQNPDLTQLFTIVVDL